MRHLFFSLSALVVASPAFAQSYGGGGLIAHQAPLPWDTPEYLGVNPLGCLGGIGYGVSNGRRAGGEGHFCGGPYGNMAWGGAHYGVQGKRAGAWLTAYNTVGMGWVGVHDGYRSRFDSAFVFTRPTIGAGIGLGSFAALEGSAYLMLPLNVVGVVQNDFDARFTFPHVGLQASLLFGDFSRKRKHREAPPEAHAYPPPPPPARPAPPQPPRQQPPRGAQPGPIQPGDLPPAQQGAPPPPPSDDRPLAIPGY